MKNAIEYARMLESKGFSREQAETQVLIFGKVMENEFATKEDLRILTQRMDQKFSEQELKLTLKLGSILVIAIGAWMAIFKFIDL